MLLVAPACLAQTGARLVADLDPESELSPLNVARPSMAGGKAFFAASTLEHGSELWVSSGKASGTRRIADIRPGFQSSAPGSMMEMDGKMYFTADDGIHGRELWVSDGTTEGTLLVTDLFPGSDSASPLPLAVAAGKLWFAATTAKGRGLWCTDGTAANTVELNPAPPPPGDRAFRVPSNFSVLDGKFYFASSPRIWRSDGTMEGTEVIEEIPQDSGFIQVNEMALIGDSIHYIVSSNFREWLWRTTGEPSAAVMIPREPGFDSWEVLRGLLPVGGKVSFFGQSEPGAELVWRCGDGTLDGSVRFDNQTFGRGSENSHLVGDIAYFVVRNATHGGELYRSDGTLEGTYLVKDIRRGQRGSDPLELHAAGKWLYFTADDGRKGREIWRTDGTAKGTRLVVETARGSGSTLPVAFTADGDSIYFLGGQLSPGGDLWRTDGSRKGTVRLTVPEQKGLSGLAQTLSFTPPIVALGNKVFFNARFSKFGIEPWTSDGTFNGTKPVGDTLKNGSANCHFMTRLGNRILYTSNPSFAVSQVWASNGSKTGTVPLTNFVAATQGFPSDFTVDGERMFFTSGQTENALWVTDGTKRGTREIPIPGSTPLNVVDGTPRMAGQTLFFAHDRRPLRHELWRSDGTPDGTVMLRNAFPAAANGGMPRLDHFTALGDSICFFSKTFGLARLWRSDGTSDGTVEVPIDFASGGYFQVLTAVPFGDRFLFLADAHNGGFKWWISDGTTGGTRILKDLPLTPGLHFQPGQVPENVIIDGILYLVIDTQAHGQELWRTDGSEEGTFMVADIFPGPEDGNPAGLQVHGNRLYFAATAPVHGRELWSSDGTGEGTFMVAEVMPGDRSSNPAMLCVAGKQLFFAADDPVAGYELHVFDLPANAGAAALAHTASRSGKTAASGEAGQGTSVPEDGEALLRLAFNLDPAGTGRSFLKSGTGTSGYPLFSRGDGVFRVEYVRRRDGRFTYRPKWSATLEPGSFAPMTGPESLVEIDQEWERVTVEQSIEPGVTRMFGLVEVTEN